MIKKHKTEIIIFLSGFLLYFIVGIILSYYLDTARFGRVLFDLDTSRVLGDLSIKDFNHYRTSVHPLFVIALQPVIYILKTILNNPIIAIILLQSILSSISLVVLYIVLGKMNIKKSMRIFFTILFGISFGQIVFSVAIETYIYAQFLLILLWLFVICKIDKKLSLFDYIILVFLGIGSIAITLTNFVQFLIAITFLILFNKKIKKRFLTSFILITAVVSISVLLAEIQSVIWPSAPNFFSKNLNDLIIGNSEEQLYISKNINIRSFLNVLNSNFSQSFNINNLTFLDNAYLLFVNTMFSNIFSILAGLFVLFINLFFMIKTKFNISKHKFYYALIITYLFNFVLHLFYGNSISFIYICHYNFILIFILAYIVNYFKINLFKYKYLLYLALFIIVALSLKNIISMFQILFPLFNPIEYFRIIPAFIIGLVASLLIALVIKHKYIKSITIIVCLLVIYLLWYSINYTKNNCEENCSAYEKYYNSLTVYKNQLKEMKNEFMVNYYSSREEPINIYYFGMANRPKILYKDGKLIDIKTKETIKDFNYESDLIVPNEYSVSVIDKEGNNYIIFENENGIYISKNDEIETIFESEQKINLPEFENHKFSEILKVTHQEVLFNIDGDIPKPNLITYKGSWYRDTMLATMVLEETNNIHLLKNWISSIDSIYDYQRDPNLKEVDNLGELLYIIGAVGVPRDDLVAKVIGEINNIKQPDGSIKGSVDGEERSYYPTVLALYGASKIGIELDLTIPNVDDGYSRLTWYHDDPQYFNSTADTRYYPYIDWAFFHHDKYYGKLYILDEIYPLSYEGGYETGPNKVESECFISEYYCEQKVFLSHIWHASEMFLYLKDF